MINLDSLALFDAENIPFSAFMQALDTIEKHLAIFRQTGLAQHLVVLGESGAGKSKLCKVVTHRHPRQVLTDRDVVPVLYVEVPSEGSISGLATELLRALGDPHPLVGTTTAKTYRIVVLCRACRVELLLIDEAQQMHDRGRFKTHYLVSDWIKRLIDTLNIPTVLLGLPNLQDLLMVNEQLRRRFSRTLTLALGQTPEISIQNECLQIFLSLAACLPVPISYSEYSHAEFADRVFYATDARVGYIKKLLSGALSNAIDQKADQINIQDLQQAFIDYLARSDSREEINPFSQKFFFRRLDRAGEPFYAAKHEGKNGI